MSSPLPAHYVANDGQYSETSAKNPKRDTESEQAVPCLDESSFISVYDQCIHCNTTLKGLGRYMFDCGSHFLCRLCLRQNTSVLEDEHCFVCQRLRSKEERNTLPCDIKNSLPLISRSDSQAVVIGANAINYKYPSRFRCPRKPHITEESKIVYDINFPVEVLLNTCHEDVVVACGQNDSRLTVLTTDGVRAVHTLSEGHWIKSGTFIRQNFYVLSLGYHDGSDKYEDYNYKFKTRCINLNVKSPTPSAITPVSHPTLSHDMNDYPLQVFNISRQRYGVLYSREYYDEDDDDENKFNVVQIHSLDTLTAHHDTDPYKIQSHVIWGRRIIRLEGSDGDSDNTISVSPKRHFCLAQWNDANVRIHSQTGLYLLDVGVEWGSGPRTPGKLYCPVTVLCTGCGEMIVVGFRGDVQVFVPQGSASVKDRPINYEYGKWSMVKNICNDAPKQIVFCSVFSESRMWNVEEVNVDGQPARVIRIYNLR